MPVRHTLLAVAAVLVSGMCIYLFLQVRASPATPQLASNSKDTKDTKDSKDTNEVATDDPPSNDAPDRNGASLRGIVRSKVNGSKAADTTAATAPSTSGPEPEGKLQGPKLDAVMAEANKAYDKTDFEEARSIAQRVLNQDPTNTRMLRIMTSSFCIESDGNEAQKYYNLLPAADREQMKTRCTRYGVTFTDPPTK